MNTLFFPLCIILLLFLALCTFMLRAIYTALNSIQEEAFAKIDRTLATRMDECRVSVNFFHFLFFAILLFTVVYCFSAWNLFFVTILILIVCEFLPAIYGRIYAQEILKFTKFGIPVFLFLGSPFILIWIKFNKIIDNHLYESEKKFSIEDLSSALDRVPQAKDTEESKILKGIVKFADIEACAIMKPRVDIVAVSSSVNFKELMTLIREAGYSRMPVYEDNLDHITGVLYIKDLLPYLKEKDNFSWINLVRPAIFIPETKKIDLLLKELKEKKVHLALVVDEYGGTSGLITLEDVLEEIVGEISDEFDSIDEENLYQKIDDRTYLFDARMSVHDFCKWMNLEDDFFKPHEGEFETLAGLILENLGRFPQKNEKIDFDRFSFVVEAMDAKRIKRIKMIINHEES